MKQVRKHILSRLQLRESWVIFFITGIIMMNFPFLNIFNKARLFASFPFLFIYLFGGWAVSIFVIYLFTKAVDAPESEHDPGGRSK